VILLGFRPGVGGSGLAVDVVPRALEMINALAAAERRVPWVRRPGLLDLLRVHVDVLIVLVVGVVRAQARILRRGSTKAGVSRAGLQIGPLAHSERGIAMRSRHAVAGAVPITRREGRRYQPETGGNRQAQSLFQVQFH
jgi:hypothetical protein